MRFYGLKAMRLVAVLLAVTALTFFLSTRLPGDPCILRLGTGATEAARERCAQELRLDDPFVVRYVKWLGAAATGDLGRSYRNNQPVAESLKETVPVSIQLMGYSMVIALGLAVPAAVYAAYRQGGWVDRISSITAFGMLSVPQFMVGVVLLFAFAVRWDPFDLPATGHAYITGDPVGHFKSMLLPSITLAVGQIAVYLRLLRTDLIATLQEDFITLARSKGLSPRRVLLGHALRPSSFTLLTVAGVNVGGLIGGAIIVETLFGKPGVGAFLVTAILARDYEQVLGGVVIITAGFVIVNFLVDLTYALLDPRVRHARA